MCQDIYEEMEKLETIANYIGYFEYMHEKAMTCKRAENTALIGSIVLRVHDLKQAYIARKIDYEDVCKCLQVLNFQVRSQCACLKEDLLEEA